MARPKVSERQKPTNPDADIWDELSAPFEREDNEGLPVVKKGSELTDIRWIKRGRGGINNWPGPRLTIAKTLIWASAEAVKVINATHVLLGTGIIDGEPALLLRPADESDMNAYTLVRSSRSKSLARRIGNASVVEKLRAAGLPLGHYELCKAKGGFVALPIKKDEND